MLGTSRSHGILRLLVDVDPFVRMAVCLLDFWPFPGSGNSGWFRGISQSTPTPQESDIGLAELTESCGSRGYKHETITVSEWIISETCI